VSDVGLSITSSAGCLHSWRQMGAPRFWFLLLTFLLSASSGELYGQAAAVDLSRVRQLRAEFQHPPKAYRPMVRWFWPGGDVRNEELKREIRLLDEANFGGAEVQPFSFGLNPEMTAEVRQRVDDYLTPSFYQHVRAVLEEARQRGLWVDFTFGSGWPFGGGEAITPELASLELRYAHQSMRGPRHFHGSLPLPPRQTGMPELAELLSGTPATLPPGWRERLDKRQKLVAVIAVRGKEAEAAPLQQMTITVPDGIVNKTGVLDHETTVVLTGHVSKDGTLDWDVPEGEWQIFTFAQSASDLRVLGGVGAGPQLVLDHLKRAAFEAHARRVGESARREIGEFFGHGLRAIFCDSLEVEAYLYWTDDFLEQFRQRRGYELAPFLPILKTTSSPQASASNHHSPLYDYGVAAIGERVRHDYWQTVSDLMIENMYQPLAQWAAQNHLQSRVQAHGAPADVMRIYGLSSIPETESLFNGGGYDFLKLAASAGHVYGRPLVSSESFVWFDQLYQTTPEKIKRYADQLLTAGINEIVDSGFPYEYMDRPEPGWYPFLWPLPFSSHINPHNPFWPYMAALNEYITRLQLISQQGTNVAPVALYRSQLPAEGTPGKREINTRLMEVGYNFDHMNADALLKSRVENKELVSPGGAHYAALILQSERSIPLEVGERLLDFCQRGLTVIFIRQAPQEESGYLDYPQKTEKIQTLMRSTLQNGGKVVQSAEDAVTALRQSVEPNLRFTGTASAPFIEKRIGNIDAFFLCNPTPEARLVETEFRQASSPEDWDPWTGHIGPLWQFQREGGKVRIGIDLPPYGSKLIVFEPGAKHEPRVASPAPRERTLAVGAQGWRFHAIGVNGTGKQETADLRWHQLVDWSQEQGLRNFSGRGTYTTHFSLAVSAFGKGRHVWLRLGEVKDVAEIKVNGKRGPTLLVHPYESDITELVRPGDNTLEITVVNSLNNAMAARPRPKPIPGVPTAPPTILPGGLIGPATIVSRDSAPTHEHSAALDRARP